jgi:hypothetical protein
VSVLDLRNYQLTPVSTGETIEPDWGNKIDRGVFAALHQGNYYAGVDTTLIRDTSGQLERVDETVDGLLYRRTALTRDSTGSLGSVTVTVYGYDANGQNQTVIAQWTDTLVRVEGRLANIEREVIV